MAKGNQEKFIAEVKGLQKELKSLEKALETLAEGLNEEKLLSEKQHQGNTLGEDSARKRKKKKATQKWIKLRATDVKANRKLYSK